MDSIAAGTEDFDGGVEIFGLEIVIEGVGEENDVALLFPSPACGGG